MTLGLVNIYAMHQACGYIRKKIMDLTRKKQVANIIDRLHQLVFSNCDTAVLKRLLDRLGLDRLGLEG